MPEFYKYWTLDCDQVEAFLVNIRGVWNLSLQQVNELWGAWTGPMQPVDLASIAKRLRIEKSETDPFDNEDVTNLEWAFFYGSALKEEQASELRLMFWGREHYCNVSVLANGYLDANALAAEYSGIMGWVEKQIHGAVEGIGTLIKDNLAIVIIIILIALTAIFAPSMILTIGKTIYTLLAKIGIATAKTLTTINGWISTVKGWLHIEEIGAIMQTVGSLSRLLEVISPTWHNTIVAWENEIAKASKALFGDANTISAYLTVVQMAVWDISSLRGKPYDMAQLEWYDQAVEITAMIDRKQEQYRDSPGDLWYDIQEGFLKAGYGDGAEHRRASAALVGQIALIADTLEINLIDLHDRLALYEEVLSPTELDALKTVLAETRLSLRVNAIKPLEDFKEDVTDIYVGQLPDRSFSERWNMLVQPALDNANILGADEVTLSAYQKEQRLKKGENLLEFISRIARGALDGVIGGAYKLYAETIGKLDRREELVPPLLTYDPIEWTLTPSLLPPAVPFKHSPPPPGVPVPPVTRREAALSSLDPSIQSIQEKV